MRRTRGPAEAERAAFCASGPLAERERFAASEASRRGGRGVHHSVGGGAPDPSLGGAGGGVSSGGTVGVGVAVAVGVVVAVAVGVVVVEPDGVDVAPGVEPAGVVVAPGTWAMVVGLCVAVVVAEGVGSSLPPFVSWAASTWLDGVASNSSRPAPAPWSCC